MCLSQTYKNIKIGKNNLLLRCKYILFKNKTELRLCFFFFFFLVIRFYWHWLGVWEARGTRAGAEDRLLQREWVHTAACWPSSGEGEERKYLVLMLFFFYQLAPSSFTPPSQVKLEPISSDLMHYSAVVFLWATRWQESITFVWMLMLMHLHFVLFIYIYIIYMHAQIPLPASSLCVMFWNNFFIPINLISWF